MAHRVNIVLDDDVWQRFQAIPGGERSRFINDVLAVELVRRQQREAWAAMQAMRHSLPESRVLDAAKTGCAIIWFPC
jgi:hypothetical protein